MKNIRFVLTISAILIISSISAISPIATGDGSENRSMDFGQYHTYDEMVTDLQTLVNEHDQIAVLYDLGDTWEGRDILAVKVSDDVSMDDLTEPDILYMGGHHGNEKISAEVPLYLLEFLLDNYGTNSSITRFIDTREIWFIPMVNPDGHEAQTRKNRRPIDLDGDGTNEGIGVDLNRNYAHLWGQQGASHNPTQNIYCGPSPFSENETIAIRNLALDRKFTLSISFHSFGEVIYYPWGNGIDIQHPERTTLEAIAGEIAERNGYVPMEGIDAYPTTGDSDDWLYANTTCLPFTVELGTEYAPHEDLIESICKQNLESSLYLLDIADDPEIATLPDWTFMVYMAGDNSLHSAALDDLNEMEVAGSTPDVNIITLFDGNGYGDSKLYRIDKDPLGSNPAIISTVLDDGGSIINQTTSEADMSLTTTLDNFIDWVNENYPAQNTALIFWNHGDGLFDGLCQDKSNFMQTWELRDAIMGEKFEIIGLDLCREGHVEVAYELLGHVDYFIASEGEEPEDGWDYSAVLEFLTNNPNVHPAELSNKIVQYYLIDSAPHTYITMAAIDMYYFENEFIPALNDFAEDISYFLSYNITSIQTARNSSSVFDPDHIDSIDFYEFLKDLLTKDVALQIRESGAALLDVMNNTIIASGSGLNFPDVGGLAIYFPVFIYNNYYDSKFQFSNEQWDEFLREYLNPTQKPFIRHTPPTDMDNTAGPYTITADITDDNLNESAVFVHYSISNGVWEISQMISNGGGFTVNLPGLQNGTVVDYYITATDLSDNTATLPYVGTKGTSEYFRFGVFAKADVFVESMIGFPNFNLTEGVDINFMVEVGNNGPEIVQEVLLSLYSGDRVMNGSLIASKNITLSDLGTSIENLSWVATEGQHDIYAYVSSISDVFDPNTSNNMMTIELSVNPSADENNSEGNVTGSFELWGGALLLLVITSTMTSALLLVAKYHVRKKKRLFALKSIRRSAYFLRSVGDLGVETKTAVTMLDRAREEFGNKRYDSAERISKEARECAELSMVNDFRNTSGVVERP